MEFLLQCSRFLAEISKSSFLRPFSNLICSFNLIYVLANLLTVGLHWPLPEMRGEFCTIKPRVTYTGWAKLSDTTLRFCL